MAYVSRNQGICHVIYIFFIFFRQGVKSHNRGIYMTHFRGRGLFALTLPPAALKDPSLIALKNCFQN